MDFTLLFAFFFAETMKSDLTDAENQKKADNKTLKAAKTANKKASTAKKKAKIK